MNFESGGELTPALNSKATHVPKRPGGETGKGYGFVRLPLSQAVAAIDQLHGTRLQRRKISIQMSESEPELSPSPSLESSSDSDSSSDDEMDISDESDDESEGNESKVELPEKTHISVSASVKNASLSNASSVGDKDQDDEDRMDLESSDASSSDYSPEPAAISTPSMAQSQRSETNGPNLADDLAPELQPTAEQQIGSSDAVSPTNGIQRMLTIGTGQLDFVECYQGTILQAIRKSAQEF